MRGAPGKYLDKCEAALVEFTEGETPVRYSDPRAEDDEEMETGDEDHLQSSGVSCNTGARSDYRAMPGTMTQAGRLRSL
jgi:hypothetical protein